MRENVKRVLRKFLGVKRKYRVKSQSRKEVVCNYEREYQEVPFVSIEESLNFLFPLLKEVEDGERHKNLQSRLEKRSYEEIEELTKELLYMIIRRQRSIAERAQRSYSYQRLIILNSIHWHLHDLMHNVPDMLERKYFPGTPDEKNKKFMISGFIMQYWALCIVVMQLPDDYVLWGDNLITWFNIPAYIERLEASDLSE